MTPKFQQIINNILENMNAAGAGGVFGAPQAAIYNPPNATSTTDSYAPGDAKNLFGDVEKPKDKKKMKKWKKKMFPVMRRNLSAGEI